MSLEHIQQAAIAVLREVQTLSGRAWTPLSSTSNPFKDLDGFDSLCSIEATVMLEKELGLGDLNTVSVFVSEDGKRGLTIAETAQLIQKLTGAVKEAR
jgi:hypothetical protein